MGKPVTTSKKHGGAKKYGRNAHKPAAQRYKSGNTRARNKVKRIFRSNGPTAAQAYAESHNALATYREMRKRSGVGQ